MTWDADALSNRFELWARQRERDYIQSRSRISRSDYYKRQHDEELAEFWVYNYIHGKIFLGSQEAFVRELNRLSIDTPTVSAAFDEDVFKRHYNLTVQRLLDEFGNAT